MRLAGAHAGQVFCVVKQEFSSRAGCWAGAQLMQTCRQLEFVRAGRGGVRGGGARGREAKNQWLAGKECGLCEAPGRYDRVTSEVSKGEELERGCSGQQEEFEENCLEALGANIECKHAQKVGVGTAAAAADCTCPAQGRLSWLQMAYTAAGESSRARLGLPWLGSSASSRFTATAEGGRSCGLPPGCLPPLPLLPPPPLLCF